MKALALLAVLLVGCNDAPQKNTITIKSVFHQDVQPGFQIVHTVESSGEMGKYKNDVVSEHMSRVNEIAVTYDSYKTPYTPSD